MKKPSGDGYVTTRELAAELRSMRWEFRFLLAMAALANGFLAFQADVPGVSHGVEAAKSAIHHVI